MYAAWSSGPAAGGQSGEYRGDGQVPHFLLDRHSRPPTDRSPPNLTSCVGTSSLFNSSLSSRPLFPLRYLRFPFNDRLRWFRAGVRHLYSTPGRISCRHGRFTIGSTLVLRSIFIVQVISGIRPSLFLTCGRLVLLLRIFIFHCQFLPKITDNFVLYTIKISHRKCWKCSPVKKSQLYSHLFWICSFWNVPERMFFLW